MRDVFQIKYYRDEGLVEQKIALLVLVAFLAFLGTACSVFGTHVQQVADSDWRPRVRDAAFPRGNGPKVLVDSAHGNWHTIDGRFAPFAELLTLDGFQLGSADQAVSATGLTNTDVFVIANPVKEGDDSEWVFPTPSAFDDDEIEAIVAWVEQGGSLLLIADHKPFPSYAAQLALAFDVVFLNGYAKASVDGRGFVTFCRNASTLGQHAIMQGRNEGERITSIKSFTGQAFRATRPIEPLLIMPKGWSVYFPHAAPEASGNTPYVSANGLVQGAVFHHGQGRVAVFGEAAMFTAQAFRRDDEIFRFGMHDPEAAQNAQFVLNVMHWLAGILENPV